MNELEAEAKGKADSESSNDEPSVRTIMVAHSMGYVM